MENLELLKKYKDLGIFDEESDEKTVVISTDKGVYVEGSKVRVLAAITTLLNQLYKDGNITKKDIEDIAEYSTMSIEDINLKGDRLEKLNNLLEEIINNLKDGGEEE